MKTLRLVTLTLLLFGSPVGAMDMKVVGNQLILSGAVDGLDYQKFLRMLTPSVQMVALSNSPGGDHQSGLDIAREIRSRGLSTVASGFCQSSCANIFLGGRERFLANNSSYLGFHGNYQSRRTVASSARIGQLKAFYSEMTGGKLSDEMVELFVGKQRGGYVAFFKHLTRNCTGTEAHRFRDCEKLPQTAMEQGILTSVDDVKINAAMRPWNREAVTAKYADLYGRTGNPLVFTFRYTIENHTGRLRITRASDNLYKVLANGKGLERDSP